jgi:transposase
MAAPTLSPDSASVELVELVAEEGGITMVVRACRPTVSCPDCGAPATRVHSWYERRLGDLPWQGLPVAVRLYTRRWFCDAPGCTRRIFTERFPALVPPHGRRTARLDTLLTALAFALGGRPGARLLAALGPVVSHDTLINTIRRAELPTPPTPRVLGVDDWSYRRGQVFGTILVDLERHQPVDVLPDRTAATFCAWLQAHPGVEVIARDRGGAYADGARQGAPDAIQIADRFHLIKNLGEALERLLDRHHAALRAAARAAAEAEALATAADMTASVAPSPAPPPERPPTRAEREKAQRHARREARYDEIHRLLAQGMGLRAVARHLGIGRDTVRRMARAARCPQYRARTPRPSILTPHEAFLRERWAAGERNGGQLWRELRERGFTGSAGIVRAFLARWRETPGRRGPRPRAGAPDAAPASPPRPIPRWRSARQVAWLLRRAAADLSPRQVVFLDQLTRSWPEAQETRALAGEFDRLVRERDAAALEPWLARAAASGLREFVEFVAGLRRDLAAVTAALTERWSSGQVEGQVTKLKLMKRAMFGRANADLLRRRVLRAA